LTARPVPTIDDLVDLLLPAWTEALGQPARADSDFFALGGTSLTAVSIAVAVASGLEQYEDIEVRALESVFASPTLIDMAAALKAFIEERPRA